MSRKCSFVDLVQFGLDFQPSEADLKDAVYDIVSLMSKKSQRQMYNFLNEIMGPIMER
jgi:hypothetical protein